MFSAVQGGDVHGDTNLDQDFEVIYREEKKEEI